MSTDEQDLILGRLTRERRECRQAVAILEAKLTEFSNVLIRSGSSLKQIVEQPAKGMDGARFDVPDSSTLLATLNELASARERLRELEDRLNRLG